MKKNISKIILALSILVILGAFGSQFSVISPGYGIDAMGQLIIPGSSGQALSLFDDSSGTTQECYIDDHRIAGCVAQKDTLSVPEGAQVIHHTSAASDYVSSDLTSGWEGYGSCAGFMSHYGCDPDTCAIHNGGVCQGEADDADIECGTNLDCDKKYPGEDKSCIYGGCATVSSSEPDDKYMCVKGQIYVWASGRYKMYGSCMDKYSVAKCADGKDTVTGDYLRDICQEDCISDSDCDSGYTCQKVKYTVDGSSQLETGGRCVIESVADDEDELFAKQEEIKMILAEKASDCADNGGEWTGTNCIGESSEDEIVVEVEEESIEDYEIECSDGSTIWYTEYVDGALCPGEEDPSPSYVPDKAVYDPGTTTGKAIIVAVILVILSGIGLFMFSGKKGKRRRK